MVKIICTDAYSDLFPVLVKELEGKVNSVEGKNLIFCEEKISLMAERAIVSRFNGSFNTQVYSFGNYLRSKRPNGKTLSKEGSAMAVKRVLSSVKLDAFKPSRATLAPSLFELIIQLKSAKVGVEELERATNECSGVLKSKLKDVTEVYKGYENFIKENGFDDQSSMLNYLPEIIENDQDIKGADVYIVGFNGWTSQLRAGIVALLRNARSVTAILVSGANEMVYVGETEQAFISACQTAGVPFIKQNASPSLEIEGKIISENLFNPTGFKGKYNTEKVFISTAENKYDECEQVARIARALVLNGKCRYKNITVAIPDINGYREELEKAFTKLEVPFFLDEKKKVGAHPLVRLAISYLEIKRKNMQRSVVTDFFKNPLFTADKKLADEFDNYILRYNVNYSRFKKPFNFPHDGEYTLEQLNAFREKLVECQNAPNIKTLFDMLSVKERLVELSERLNELVELEERAINEQIYDKVITLADEMDSILGGVNLSLPEIKEILLSGFSAMELSIIPQYNDAVFVGGYKQTALAKADYLFALGLTQDVPSIRNDVALLSDGDISVLEEIKVMVEPKIRVVNHREREHVALALSAFNKGLFVSYPLTAINGDKAFKGEVFSFIENTFTTKKPKNLSGYTTYKDGLSTFAKACGEFASGKIEDFTLPTSFYKATQKQEIERLLSYSDKQVKERLDKGKKVMKRKEISPSRIEDFYKCPYRAFLSNALKLKPREEGVVDGFSIGNFMHEIFCAYALKTGGISSREESDALVYRISQDLLKKEEYGKFIDDSVTKAMLDRALKECATYCYKNYLALRRSKFKVTKTEATIGKGYDGNPPDYPAILLSDGKVRLTGKIDRVDESDDYFRILDYKTVSPSANIEHLFTGKKLQLYLYANAVRQSVGEKKLAGVYYLSVNERFREDGESDPALSLGVTLDKEQAVKEQDENALKDGESLFFELEKKDGINKIKGATDEQALNCRIEYAKLMAEQAVKLMNDGVIIPSPCDDNICSYCNFRSICSAENPSRKLNVVSDQTIVESVLGGEEECPN